MTSTSGLLPTWLPHNVPQHEARHGPQGHRALRRHHRLGVEAAVQPAVIVGVRVSVGVVVGLAMPLSLRCVLFAAARWRRSPPRVLGAAHSQAANRQGACSEAGAPQ